jgi:antitoxin PrlF
MTVMIEQSRITSKGQTTIPKAVRQTLGVDVGDAIAFKIEDGRVEVQRAPAGSGEDPALEGFLALLADNIRRRPEVLEPLTPAFRARIVELTGASEVDVEAPIEGEIAL